MSDNDPVPTGAETRARARDKSGTDLDTQILNDNVMAAISASERLHMLAKKKLQEQGLAPAASSGGLTEDDLHQLAVGLVGWLIPILKDIETRLAQVEASAVMDGGTWEQGKTYRRSQVIQDRGAVWVCTVSNTTSRPPGDDWRLWVRREKRERK